MEGERPVQRRARRRIHRARTHPARSISLIIFQSHSRGRKMAVTSESKPATKSDREPFPSSALTTVSSSLERSTGAHFRRPFTRPRTDLGLDHLPHIPNLARSTKTSCFRPSARSSASSPPSAPTTTSSRSATPLRRSLTRTRQLSTCWSWL